jgi:two-component system alkaline phosphatase synthesis response regulator PhoP
MTTILIVEDERNLSNLIRGNLEEEGYHVQQAFDGPSALETAVYSAPDLIILDIMLPGMDGLEVCRRLRQDSIVPILMLTARAEEIDRVLGLELGADDYLTKPFSMRELKARVRSILRRVEMMQAAGAPLSDEALAVEGLCLDPASYEATLGGQALDLTPKEFALLYLLVRHPGRVFSRTYLLDEIWGYNVAAYDRTVDTHIYRLRQKLGADNPVTRRIVAVRGIGYKFGRE